MAIKDILETIDISPKVNFLITASCLLFVLANNHFYLNSLAQKEKDNREREEKIQIQEEGLLKKERTLRLWEIELISREKDLSRVIEEIREAKASQSGKKSD